MTKPSKPITPEFVANTLYGLYPNSTILTAEVIAEYCRRAHWWTENEFVALLDEYRNDPKRLEKDDLKVAPLVQQLFPLYWSRKGRSISLNLYRYRIRLESVEACKVYDLALRKCRFNWAAKVLGLFGEEDGGGHKQMIIKKLNDSWEDRVERGPIDEDTPDYKQLSVMYNRLMASKFQPEVDEDLPF